MKEILDLEEINDAYSLKATTPIYNLIKPSQDDFYNVDDFNHNADIIEGELDKQAKQITGCLGEIEKVRGEIGTAIGGIDLSSVNAHTTNIGENTKSHVTSARDNTNNHITSQHTATKNTVNSARDNTNGVVNSARDNIRSHVTSEVNRVISSSGDIAGKTYVKVRKIVLNGGNASANLTAIDYSNSKGGIFKYSLINNILVDIYVDGALVHNSAEHTAFEGSSPFGYGQRDSIYGDLPTYPFKNSVKVVDRATNSGDRVHIAHLYINK